MISRQEAVDCGKTTSLIWRSKGELCASMWVLRSNALYNGRKQWKNLQPPGHGYYGRDSDGRAMPVMNGNEAARAIGR